MGAMAQPAASILPTEEGRTPQEVLPGLWLFAPSRDSQGGSAWLLERSEGDVLVDCPGFTLANLRFLAGRARPGGVGAAASPWIVLTGRHGHGRCLRLQQALGWPVLVQEQEAYLLPGVEPLHTFEREHPLGVGLQLLWTPGPSPGSCVLHATGTATGSGSPSGGAALDGLFCGRLLVPVAPARLAPLRLRGTFHWGRQLSSLERLRQWLPSGSPRWIASGAGLGALRGPKLVFGADRQLAELDLDALTLDPGGGLA